MLKSYFVLAWRTLRKYPHYTVINVLGLAFAIAGCVLAYVNFEFAYGFDAQYENADEIYLLNAEVETSGWDGTWGVVPMPMAPTLESEVSGIERTARLNWAGVNMRVGDQVFQENGRFAESSVMAMFDFPLRYGSPAALDDPQQVVLEARTAEKYFGDANPIGSDIELRFRNDSLVTFTVGAVTEPILAASSLQFDLLIPYVQLERIYNTAADDWSQWALTFVQAEDAAIAQIAAAAGRFVPTQNAANENWPLRAVAPESLLDVALTSPSKSNYWLKQGVHPAAIVSPGIIAILVLLMACFNFMNTSISFAGRRMKEIGVRKSLGGGRRQLILQFLGESLILCALSLGLGLLLAHLIVPGYNALWPTLGIDLQISYADNAMFLLFLAGLVLFTGLLSGGWPAAYVSRFRPVEILKGQQPMARFGWLGRTLLVFQFAAALMAVITSAVFLRNAEYQDNLDYGYATEALLTINTDTPSDYAAMRAAALADPDVEGVVGTNAHLSYRYNTLPVAALGAESDLRAEVYAAEPGYAELVNLTLLAGRFHEDGLDSDASDGVVVSEALVDGLGLGTTPAAALGERFLVDSTAVVVVGVVANVFSDGPWDDIDPFILRARTNDNREGVYPYLVVKTQPGRTDAVETRMEEAWKAHAPDVLYSSYEHSSIRVEPRAINRSIVVVFAYSGFGAVLIAAVGLFAMVSLTITRRTKEMGVRKVLGATVSQISVLLNREFVVLLLVAVALASALCLFVLPLLLNSIWTYHAGLSFGPFLAGITLLFAIAALTVARQIWRVATVNPTEVLRYE
ncbi:MAG: ABC transporter permease [Bacteroidota bacterium]